MSDNNVNNSPSTSSKNINNANVAIVEDCSSSPSGELDSKLDSFRSLNDGNSQLEEGDDDNNDDTESDMDISSELKKEIYEIIVKTCVMVDSQTGWSSQLPFSELLQKLRVTEREELTVSIVFVALLHLCNEYGIKLIQEPFTENQMNEIYITRPINN